MSNKFYEDVNYKGLAASMPDDDRQKVWEDQFKENGFDDTYFWNLDITIVKIIQPLLNEFGSNKFNISGFENKFKTVLSNFTEINNSPDECINGTKIKEAFEGLSTIIDGLWN